MERLEYCAPCLFGVEGILGDELRRLGAEDVRPENGRVLFRGGLEMMARANICSRYAERIQVLMGRFKAYSFEELFQGVRALEWERFISKQDSFPVKGWSLNSKSHSVPDCQAIVKKAVVERLKNVYGIQWFDECDGKCQIQFSIMKDEVTIMLDTSGVGLHKRGYRAVSGGAPIKETLAAAIVDVTRARRAKLVCDPCCGSGTLMIEAALAAKGAGAAGEKPVDADLTLPGRWFGLGSRHPLSRVVEESAAIFGRLGFTVADGPELETRFNNFTALNTPPHHPSQDRTDTFWFGDDCLLRTQTSPVQIRTMMANKPPVRVICPGRTFRRDTTDATHSANFHQIEGLYVDCLPKKPVSLADLKSVLAYFAKAMMGDSVTVRFRPHFFPFTEPSVEVDFSCHVCKGKDGCRRLDECSNTRTDCNA